MKLCVVSSCFYLTYPGFLYLVFDIIERVFQIFQTRVKNEEAV